MKRRRRETSEPDNVEPDLPITPMLDMSFQLLFFFVVTFNPIKAEGHLMMALPNLEGGPTEKAPDSPPKDEEELVVAITANRNGGLGKITVGSKKDTTAPEEIKIAQGDKDDLSTAVSRYLKKRAETKGTCKVKLEIDEALLYQFVVKLIDDINQAGYKNVAPALLDIK